ncbi:MAG: hypothetical protein SFV15_24095 [Polyangiaceae bacterium]|nr:hypothetical protein [Polyangiaceae bacterium]
MQVQSGRLRGEFVRSSPCVATPAAKAPLTTGVYVGENLRNVGGDRIILRFLENGEVWAFLTYTPGEKVRCEPVDIKQAAQRSKSRWPKPLLARYCAGERELEFELRGFNHREASPVRYTFTVSADAQQLRGASDYDENIEAHWVEFESVCLAPGTEEPATESPCAQGAKDRSPTAAHYSSTR